VTLTPNGRRLLLVKVAAGEWVRAETTLGTWELPKPTGRIMEAVVTLPPLPRSPWLSASNPTRRIRTGASRVGGR
jgi:hypothetical protein